MSADSYGNTSIEKIRSALDYVYPDDRAVWLKVGMGLKAELGDAGFEFFDNWSRIGSSYSESAAKSVWRSFKAGGKVTIASLFYLAKDAGWSWDQPDVKPSAEAIEQWRAESRRKAEEAEAEKARLNVAAAKRAAAIWESAEPASSDHPYLERKGVLAHGLKVGRWEVVDRETGEVRLIHPKALLVPIKDRTGALWSLQAIFPTKVMGGRDKDYLADGLKIGHFHPIGKPAEHAGRKVFILCEGYATGASIHEATGHLVLVCFDTSGLLPVAVAIRERVPDAIILIAADNDLWTRKKDGTPYNPGIESATKAAIEVGGLLAVPPFTADDQTGVDEKGRPVGPTDFNDLDDLRGSDAVRGVIQRALNAGHVVVEDLEPDPDPEPAADPDPEQPAAPPWEGEAAFPDGKVPDAELPKVEGDDDLLEKGKYFTVLGMDKDTYYFFVHDKQQVIDRTPSQFNEIGLLGLANDINWWKINFTNGKDGVNVKAAFQWIQNLANKRGIYDPTNIRGRGAWLDNGRSVYHLGDKLMVDGKELDLDQIKSAYVYPRSKRMPRPSTDPLTMEEGRALLDVSRQVRWSMQGSAVLMSGWVFLAPICGALKWRPHIWLTGAPGSGKTTIQRDYCYALTRGISRYGQGDSTEPGIRQDLASDALPVLIDEFETNDEKEKVRVETVIAMIRKASSESEAVTMKGTVSGDGVAFKVRSMFCLGSVNTKLDKQADVDRITKLVIRVPPKDGSQVDHWRKLEADLYAIGEDETLPSRLMARAVSMIPKALQCVKVFVKAAAERFGSQRMGDQYGTLIAGCWCLTNDHVPSADEAREMILAYDWDEHTEDQDQDDAKGALDAILNSKIRMSNQVGDITVDELVREANTAYREGLVDQAVAVATLRRHGMKVVESSGVLLFGTNVPNLKTLLKSTSFSSDVRGQLLRVQGAERWKTERFSGASSKCVAIPLSLIMEEVPAPPSVYYDDPDCPI